MGNLPDLFLGGAPSRQVVRATRAREGTELAIYEHGLQARYLAEIDRIDSEAVGDVVTGAMEEEITSLKYGLELAAGSLAAAELVTRLVDLESRLDNRRIARRFGG